MVMTSELRVTGTDMVMFHLTVTESYVVMKLQLRVAKKYVLITLHLRVTECYKP
jgi:hypothetical protein